MSIQLNIPLQRYLKHSHRADTTGNNTIDDTLVPIQSEHHCDNTTNNNHRADTNEKYHCDNTIDDPAAEQIRLIFDGLITLINKMSSSWNFYNL